MNRPVCCQCGTSGEVTQLYGYTFCNKCKGSLGLHSDKTISKNAGKYPNEQWASYDEEIASRLQAMEKKFAMSRVKLLHILERLSELQ